MTEVRLYVLQRISAMVMAPLVMAHLALMIYAIQGGLSAAEILSRTQGSFWWGGYYGLFVAAVSIHGALGLRVIIREELKWPDAVLNTFTFGAGLVLLTLGLRAVMAVVL